MYDRDVPASSPRSRSTLVIKRDISQQYTEALDILDSSANILYMRSEGLVGEASRVQVSLGLSGFSVVLGTRRSSWCHGTVMEVQLMGTTGSFRSFGGNTASAQRFVMHMIVLWQHYLPCALYHGLAHNACFTSMQAADARCSLACDRPQIQSKL